MPQRTKGGGRLADGDPIAFAFQDHPQRPADVRLVVHDDDVVLAAHDACSACTAPAAGSVMRNAAPPSSPRISTRSPPHRSAFFLAIDSPSPIPCFLNVIVG